MKRLLSAAIVCLALSPLSAYAQSADQEIVSAVDAPDPVAPGATLAYTVTVRNNGPDPAVNGGININLPLAVSHTTDSVPAGWSCAWLGNNGSCTTPSFAPSTQVITINVTVDPSLANFPDQSISANFFPSGTTPDPNTANNMKTATTLVDSSQVDLTLTASDSPDPVFPDGNVTYTVNVGNSGPDTASSVTFNVVPNPSLQFQSATVPAGWTCTLPSVNAVNATFSCTRPTYAAGASSQFTVVFRADDAQFGVNDTTFQTYFEIGAGSSNETNNANNSETETTAYVTPDADMSVAVTDSPDPVSPDGNITYTITVSNNGPDAAPSAALGIFNNNSLRFQSITTPAGWTCTPPAVDAAPVFDCTNPSFANGASSVFTLVLRAYASVLGYNDGTVSAAFSASSSVSDPNNANDVETEMTTYDAPSADLAVTATDAPDPVTPGNSITYSGTVTSAGPDAVGATFQASLAAGLLFQSLSGPAGFSCSTPAIGANGLITCTAASFASGASAPFTLVAQVDPALNSGPGGTIAQTFSISQTNANDPNGANNSVTVNTTYTTPVADLSLTTTDAPDPVVAGGSITYTHTITNNGPDPATNATFSMTTPAGTTFQSIGTPAGWSCTSPSVGGTGTIQCTKATVANGESVAFAVVLTATGAGPINATATVTSATNDPNSANGSTTSTTAVVAPASADLSVTKTTPVSTASAGSTIPYTIIVTNNGPDAATTVVLTDVLISSLQFRSITAPAGFSCTTPPVGATGTITCTGATLANGASATFALMVDVAAGATGTVTNTATVSSATADGNGANSSSSAPSVPVVPAAAAVAVPTLSEWALIALALALAAVASRARL